MNEYQKTSKEHHGKVAYNEYSVKYHYTWMNEEQTLISWKDKHMHCHCKPSVRGWWVSKKTLCKKH